MRPSLKAVPVFLALACHGFAADGTTKVIRFRRLVAGPGKVLSNAAVVVEGDRIRSVGTTERPVAVPGAVIDLTPYTGIPGLIDVHTHMTYYWDQAPGTLPRSQSASRLRAVDATHALGKRIAIHSYGPAGARDAVRAGADSLGHAVDIDEETIAEMVRRKTFDVPTIDHNRFYVDNGEKSGFAPGYAERLNAFIERNLETARRAFRAGVRVAMGSDAVYTMFGPNTREPGWFAKAGMSPEQALAGAARNGAALLGMETRPGEVAPGYYADIVAVEGEPARPVACSGKPAGRPRRRQIRGG